MAAGTRPLADARCDSHVIAGEEVKPIGDTGQPIDGRPQIRHGLNDVWSRSVSGTRYRSQPVRWVQEVVEVSGGSRQQRSITGAGTEVCDRCTERNQRRPHADADKGEEQTEPAIYTRELGRRIRQGLVLRERGDRYTPAGVQKLSLVGQDAVSRDRGDSFEVK